MILTVYGRFFKLYMATAIAPIPLSSFAGQPSSSIGMAFIKSYAAICLEGCVILLACIIFSQFASSPPVVTEGLAPATVIWNYIGELVFNMLVLVGSIKMSDRIIRELMGLGYGVDDSRAKRRKIETACAKTRFVGSLSSS